MDSMDIIAITDFLRTFQRETFEAIKKPFVVLLREMLKRVENLGLTSMHADEQIKET